MVEDVHWIPVRARKRHLGVENEMKCYSIRLQTACRGLSFFFVKLFFFRVHTYICVHTQNLCIQICTYVYVRVCTYTYVWACIFSLQHQFRRGATSHSALHPCFLVLGTPLPNSGTQQYLCPRHQNCWLFLCAQVPVYVCMCDIHNIFLKRKIMLMVWNRGYFMVLFPR